MIFCGYFVNTNKYNKAICKTVCTHFGSICIAYRMKSILPTVYETDERMYFLRRLLADFRVDAPLHIFAPNILLDETKLAAIESDADVIFGKCEANISKLADERNIRLHNIMKDEKFQAVNSRLSAEGALMIMLEHSVKSIENCKVLVLGFGRMGAATVKLLCRLGVPTDVATTSSERPAYAFAERVLPMKNFDFAPYDIIVNTVPHAVVSDADLMSMRHDAVYIDLASKPAINLEYARYLGIDAEIYPAIPAKVCPFSAAVAMQEFITEVIK